MPMRKVKKDVSKQKEATLFEMFDYFCACMDFSKSALDGTGVQCMNNLFIELRKQKEKYPIN